MGVAIPSFITAFTLAASLEYAARRRGGKGLFGWWAKLPYFDKDRWLFSYFISGLFLFLYGGITGLINASANMNGAVHNTTWVPAHFHTTVGGPVFMAFTGMSLHILAKMKGLESFTASRWNLSVPYLWMVGVFLSSTGTAVAGLMGMPRRTNLGPTYLNPDSPLYAAQWKIGSMFGAVGGVIMTISMIIFFCIFFALIFKKTRGEGGNLSFPTAEAYHDEKMPWLQSFRPWLVVMLLAVIFAYVPPIYEIVTGTTKSVPAYVPDSPVKVGP
jgi:cytochrome c oxidase subunit 1